MAQMARWVHLAAKEQGTLSAVEFVAYQELKENTELVINLQNSYL